MMKVECEACGEDCSNAYGTHNGYPYHFGCMPLPKRRRDDLDDADDRDFEAWKDSQ